MNDLRAELDVARQLARLGGTIAAAHYGRDPEVRRKPDGTWVTEADWRAEAEIRVRLARTFPEHNILGEEEGLTSSGGGEPVPGAHTWIIDPIDGTNNFMRSIPIWGTLVALQIDGRSVVGAAYAPALDEFYDAAVGLGARMNDRPIAVDPLGDLAGAVAVLGGERYFEEIGMPDLPRAVARRVDRTRGFGDFWGHTLVARGAAHLMIDPILSVWDYAALEPIVNEAGGRISQLDGSPLAPEGSVLSSNGVLHDPILKLAASLAPG